MSQSRASRLSGSSTEIMVFAENNYTAHINPDEVAGTRSAHKGTALGFNVAALEILDFAKKKREHGQDTTTARRTIRDSPSIDSICRDKVDV